jgi:hypothetical protein
MPTKWWMDRRIWAGVILACVFLALLIFWPGKAAAVMSDVLSCSSGGYTVFAFPGIKQEIELKPRDADANYKIQYLIGGSWTDWEPETGSPKDYFTVFAGDSDRYAWSYFGSSVVDSTRVLIEPESTTDITVRVR